ncbi:unnamed protein product [Ilex paraguariensis]|uniref:lipid-A-disaccharide synthase n=1 Tax=Ilex paraguariensis TaxID=185542 RepID=A0ABC8RBC4_9AQUA
MIPIFSDTMELLKDSFSELTTVVHVAPNRHVEEYVSKAVREWPVSVVLIPGGSPQLKYDAYSVSDKEPLHLGVFKITEHRPGCN